MKKILVIGGGFAGLWAALAAARLADKHSDELEIVLVSASPFLTIRPRLYEAHPEKLRVSLHDSLDPVGVTFVDGVVDTIDCRTKTVSVSHALEGRDSYSYDRLILAAGSTQKPLPLPGAVEHSWDIDTYESAIRLDAQLRDVVQHPDKPGNSTIVIVGAGFTGIELATEMRKRLEFHGDAERAAAMRIVLIEVAGVVGPELGANPRTAIELALRSDNIDVRTATKIAGFERNAITLSSGERIDSSTVIVTAGLRANKLTEQFDVEKDALGRLPVDDTLHVKGISNVFAAGDSASAKADETVIAPMSCQHAMPMGRYAGHNAAAELLNVPLRPYRQPDYVTCIDLGTSGAVFTRGWDRKVVHRGEAAKERKQHINTERIYPPQNDRRAILKAADIDTERPRLATE